MVQWFQQVLGSLVTALSRMASWIVEQLEAVARVIWDGLLSSLASVLEAVPWPDWLSSAAGHVGAIPSSVLWFLDPFEVPYGLMVVSGAYLVRFLIRRLPIVG